MTTANTSAGVLLTDKDKLGRTTTYIYDSNGRREYVVAPEGTITSGVPTAGYVKYSYDARGNVKETRQVAKTPNTPAEALPDIVTTADYDVSCANPVTCNQPNWTKDALGRQTDYTYDPTHGGVLTVKAPAADATGVRPETRYTYTALQAYYDKGSGIVASGQPVYRLTGTSTCLTGASCVGTADEAKTSVSYGPQVAGTGNNLLPVSVTNSSGDGAISATTTLAYDAVGNVTSVDGPLAGTADTTVYVYDALRRKTGVMGPDPDGAGARKNAASRVTYNARGQVTLTEQGYTAGQTVAAWNAFTPAASVANEYDSITGFLQTRSVKNGANTYGVTQYRYDGEGRVDCVAVRMDPAQWGSQTGSGACSPQTTGPNGPDRVTKYTYDALDRVTQVRSAYGTAQVSTETTDYTPNGKMAHVIDANGNRTSYEYDGHDRLVKTRYPDLAKGAGTSSTSDFELLTYGDNVYVTQVQLRDGNTVGFTYDNLGRVTAVSGATVPARTFTYNLAGMQTGATLTATGQSVTNTHDAFGRVKTQTTPTGTVSYQYDAASRRTRMTWPDAFYVTYDHDVTGQVTAIRESGAPSGIGVLASYSYDDLGRRTGVTYGNGTSRSYAYDALGRLAGLKIDPAGTTSDLVIGAVGGTGSAVSYNPASQITGIARSNDAYAWNGAYNLSRNYTTNGLNQYTASGSTALGYDARGNLTSSGSTSYTYNGLNQLTSVTGGPSATLAYDAADRLYQLDSGGVTTRFLYDGVNMIGEYNASNALLRRFVPGPGTDEPVVWYEGSGTTDRRWLQADERGSVIAVTDASGNAVTLNAYDDYGIPGATNAGRFQYTGQVWLGEVGLYYYKARFYSPTLGRFMQTDPIGYQDGLNWYNYVGSDPINGTDPSGLDACDDGSRPDCDGSGPIVVNGLKPSISGKANAAKTTSPSSNSSQGRGGKAKPQSPQCSSSPSDGILGSARAVLETTATGADIATLGFTAGGVTAPIAVATKLVGYGAEAGLLGVNLYDGFANGSWGGLEVQAAGAATRLIPGGRALQSGLKAARGPTGVLRNSLGQFRSSYLNNPAVAEAGDLALQNGAQAAAGAVACR